MPEPLALHGLGVCYALADGIGENAQYLENGKVRRGPLERVVKHEIVSCFGADDVADLHRRMLARPPIDARASLGAP